MVTSENLVNDGVDGCDVPFEGNNDHVARGGSERSPEQTIWNPDATEELVDERIRRKSVATDVKDSVEEDNDGRDEVKDRLVDEQNVRYLRRSEQHNKEQ